jgi:hypothetical protein
MELIFQLAAGAMGALTSVLLLALVTPMLARLFNLSPAISGAPGVGSQIAQVAVRILAGVGFGLMFWLSWGLTAIVNVPWWHRGILFALLAWAVFALPMLLASALAQRVQWRVMIVTAVEWLVTVACVSMTCAWVWIRPM